LSVPYTGSRPQWSRDDRYLEDLLAEVGPPTAAQRARARLIAQRLTREARRKVS
jgi:hypothetical protein